MNALTSLLPAQDGTGFDPTNLLFIGIVIAVVYFLMWRPEQKRRAEQKSMLDSLKKNDKVMTAGGIRGIVDKVKEDEVSIKVDENKGVCLRIAKSSIAQVFRDSPDKDSE